MRLKDRIAIVVGAGQSPGEGIANGFEFALKKRGGQLGGRPVQILKADDQLDPKIGGEVTQKLVTRDKP